MSRRLVLCRFGHGLGRRQMRFQITQALSKLFLSVILQVHDLRSWVLIDERSQAVTFACQCLRSF